VRSHPVNTPAGSSIRPGKIGGEEREPPNLEVYEFASIGSAGPEVGVGAARKQEGKGKI